MNIYEKFQITLYQRKKRDVTNVNTGVSDLKNTQLIFRLSYLS